MEQFRFPRSFAMTIVCIVWRVGWEGWRSVVNVLNVSAVGAKNMVSLLPSLLVFVRFYICFESEKLFALKGLYSCAQPMRPSQRETVW